MQNFVVYPKGSQRVVIKRTGAGSAASIAAWVLGRDISRYEVWKTSPWTQIDISSANGDVTMIQKLLEEV